MKILVICQHYWPEPYPLPDICEELVRRGHDVHIITDIPNYPMGIIYPEYKNQKHRKEEHNGVQITRTFTIGRRHNVVFRLLNYYSYAISSSIYAKKIKEDYDIVFANQSSPVMMSSAAFVYAKRHNKKVVMYCMDLWPACLAAGGLSKSSPIYKLFGRISSRLYKQPDRILITSRLFRDYLVYQHGVDNQKISYLPQYANECYEKELPEKNDHTTVNLLFAGNIGVAQSLSTVIQAAAILKNQNLLRWHIVGDGSELENLKAMTNQMGLTNVIFHGRKPLKEMPYYYAMADAMLVTLIDDPIISLTLPGKVQTYMAAGKPIIGAASGEISEVITAAECGYCAGAGDSQGLAEAVKRFLQCDDKRQLGENARRYYCEHFTRKDFMDTLENELKHFAEMNGENAYESTYDGI